MARITVEDCLEEITNRFELVSLAAQRTKAIRYGSPITVDEDNDKKPVIALREISKKNLDIGQLREDLISSLQTRNKVDIIEDENLHAENQENISDEIDLSDETSNIFGNEDNLSLEADAFDDNIEEENHAKPL
jgi:DNA-directed RNA polymerase subunit omega